MKSTLPPALAMATAWLAPLPPHRLSKPEEDIVSPGRDIDFTLRKNVNQESPGRLSVPGAATIKILIDVWGEAEELVSWGYR